MYLANLHYEFYFPNVHGIDQWPVGKYEVNFVEYVQVAALIAV